MVKLKISIKDVVTDKGIDEEKFKTWLDQIVDETHTMNEHYFDFMMEKENKKALIEGTVEEKLALTRQLFGIGYTCGKYAG